MNKQLLIQGALYVIIGALSPIAALLTTDQEITNRVLTVMIISGILSGATALKAFLSTTFAQSKESELPNPPLGMRREREIVVRKEGR